MRPLLQGFANLPEAWQVERGVLAGQIEERFEYLRAHRPGGWEPEIRFHGSEHVEAARAANRGLLFWGSSFAFNDLIAKIALHRLDLNVYHYTRPVHGLSDTRFGIRVLNPVRTSIECAYLGARVSGEENISGAMQVLKNHLAAGGAVSIKTGNRGKRRASAPFFGGRLELATGTITLANRWGAALLPTFTLRRADGSFDFIVGAELDSPAANEELRALDIVQRYADQIAPLVRAEPLQWRGWRFMIPVAKAEDTGT
jgi:lauroyl/myristoyl acyltransferase